jgi:branched-chain amino acid transport system substrate-binding protein
MKKRVFLFLAIFLVSGCDGGDEKASASGTRGVTDAQIVIGTQTDLSGILAIWGVPHVNGMRMRFDEINEAGGVHGRTIDFVVEDSQYQVPLSVKAVNKLLNVDEVFAMLGAIGTPNNNATFGRMFEANVPSLFPLTAAKSMYDPWHRLKFSFFVSYQNQVRGGMRHMVEATGVSKVCLQSPATDYGAEVVEGYELAVEELGLESVYVGAVRDAGWDGIVISNMVPYIPEIAVAADGGMDGLYAASPFFVPGTDNIEEGSWVAEWYERHRDKYGEAPTPQSIIGYNSANLLVIALEKAGLELTTDAFIAALESIDSYEDPFGGPSMSFSRDKHLGSNALNLYQVRDRRWETVAESIPF